MLPSNIPKTIVLFGLIFGFFAVKELKAQSYPFKEKKSIYKDGWIDLNKNGHIDPYENPKLSIDQRVDDLVGHMTMQEKTAQMVTIYGYGAVLKDEQPTKKWLQQPWKDGMGNMDEQLNGRKESDLLWPPARHNKSMNNIQRFFIEQTRLGIPVDFTNEGIHGLKARKATSFPVEIGMGSTWDPSLENQIAHVEGKEAKALGYTNIYSPVLGLSRDPRWGRTVETFGEDPYLVSKMGVEMVNGLQDEGVASTLKHFGIYSVPKGGRDGWARTDPHVTLREAYTLYLQPFEAAVKAGAMGVMSSYNDYNGIPVTGSYHFLTQILRQQWGFDGYVVTDSGALKFIHSKHHVAPEFSGAVWQAVEAGVNVRTDFQRPEVYLKPLRKLVKNGEIPMSTIDQRVREILKVKFQLGIFDHPYINEESAADLVHTDQSQALSLKAARESLILLKNKNKTLPLEKDNIHSILVVGANATEADGTMGSYGPSGLKPTSVLDGIKNSVSSSTKVSYVKGPKIRDEDWPESDIMPTEPNKKEQQVIDEAVQKAKQSDVAIVVVGENLKTVGESRSRVSLNLPGHQLAMVQAIQQTGTPMVVVLMNGRPLSINWINDHVPAIIEAWFPGEKQGDAIADALFGDYNPGGKLPITVPKTVGQVPINFPYMPSSQAESDAKPWRARVRGPLYPFGYGLSYTNFEYSNLQISPDSLATGGSLKVSVNVKNTGSYKGDEVVQLYLNEEYTPVVTPEKVLRSFKRVTIAPGQSKQISFELTPKDLALLNKNLHWQVVPGTFDVMIGSSSEDIRQKGTFKVTGKSVNKAYDF